MLYKTLTSAVRATFSTDLDFASLNVHGCYSFTVLSSLATTTLLTEEVIARGSALISYKFTHGKLYLV
jgi:hypothetical protein